VSEPESGKKEITAYALDRVLLRACKMMNGPKRQCAEPCARCRTAGDALFTVVELPRFVTLIGIGVVDFGESDPPK
jgi:hypothetical protein